MAKKNGAQQVQSSKDEGQKEERQRPAHEVRIGRLRATLWANHHETQGTWYSITLTRSYKDKGGEGQWKTATSFGRDDLLVMSEICRQAFHWIHRQYQQQNQQPIGSGGQEGVTDTGPSEKEDDIPF